MNDLGRYIEERRLVKGWSKRALGIKAGISRSEVCRIESGVRANSSVLILNALADALEVPKDDVLMAAGYKSGDGNAAMIERVFPGLKSEKQRQTAQRIIDGMIGAGVLDDSVYDRLAEHVEMFLDFAKKKRGVD